MLDCFLNNPKGRVALYKTLRQEENDIIVQFANSKKSIRFKGGWSPENQYAYVQTAKGLQYIEWAMAIHRHNKYLKSCAQTDASQIFAKKNNFLRQLSDGSPGEAYDAIIGRTNKSENFLKTIGKELWYELTQRNKTEKILKKYANNENYILSLSLRKNPKKSSEFFDDLFTHHEYAVKGYDTLNKKLYVANPHNSSTVMEIPLNEILALKGLVAPYKLV